MVSQQSDDRPDSSAGSTLREEPASPFLFAGACVSGPLEELDATAEKKIRMYSNLGDNESAMRVRRAHELARAKLKAALSASRISTGFLPEAAAGSLAPPKAAKEAIESEGC